MIRTCVLYQTKTNDKHTILTCEVISLNSIGDLMSALQTAGATASYEHHRRERFELSSKSEERIFEHLVGWIMEGNEIEAGCGVGA